jgi:imidazolonepropionase-like amidohydrolase
MLVQSISNLSLLERCSTAYYIFEEFVMVNSYVLAEARVINLESGSPIPHGFVRIRGESIEEIGSMEEFHTTGDERVFNLEGRSVLPGLIDSHCHLISENAYPVSETYIVRSTVEGVRASRMALEAGLTSVRDVGCRHLGIYALRAAIQAGEVLGPRFQTAGRPIAGTGIMETWRSHSHDGPDEMLRGVRSEWQHGAGWIKVSVSDGRWRGTDGWCDTPLVTSAEIRTIVDEAHNKDMRVVCHVDGPRGAKLAVDARVDSIEHGVSIPDDLLDQMAAHGIVFVPTVWIYSSQDLKVFNADISFLNDLHADSIRRARAAGVKIAAGVDCGYNRCLPLEGMVNELTALVNRGLTEIEAIQAATIRGAELLGWENEIGSLVRGKLADLVVVDGDPLDQINNIGRIVLVLQHGRIVRNHLDGNQNPVPVPLPDLFPSWMRNNRKQDSPE